MLNYIIWAPSEVAFHVGPLAIRWYSLCWLVGLALAYVLMHRLYRQQKIADEKFEPLFLYCFVGILVGARLGHCLFYEPEVWLSSWTRVMEIVVPVRVLADGSWHFTGYQGLASHGGVLGLLAALWLYQRHTKLPGWQILDNMGIVSGITAAFIRLGNLMNSEIVGAPSNVPWAFIFANGDPSIATEPRHPGQLYEALAYLVFFAIILWLYKKRPEKVGTGLYFGLCLTLIFTFRFFIEFLKEVQVASEVGMMLNIGQKLSIPIVLLGAWSIWRSRGKQGAIAK